MITVSYQKCTGCGECLQYCPNEAIFLQNNKAVIDQDRCDECTACMEACPEGAIILTQYEESEIVKTVKLVEDSPAKIHQRPIQATSNSIRSAILPALGSILIWTGTEVLPRLSNLILKNLDKRVQSPNQDLVNSASRVNKRRFSTSNGGGRRRQRQRRKRRS
jgi:NAD-dependent dihydropyrimidine dehydrogenase PreA subunit